MEKQFVSYEIALALKEKGFDESCLAFFFAYLKESLVELKIEPNERTNAYFIRAGAKDCCLAPTRQQVVDWFEEKHKLFLCVEHGGKFNGNYKHDVVIWGATSVSMRGFTSTAKAWEKAILKALTLI